MDDRPGADASLSDGEEDESSYTPMIDPETGMELEEDELPIVVP